VRGVFVNIVTVLAGTAVGLGFGRLIHERFRTIAMTAMGLATLAIGMKMAISTHNPVILVGSLVVGSIIGEAAGIERRLESFGEWLQRVVHGSALLAPSPDRHGHTLVEGFVTASLLYCVGAMTILGSIKDGLGDPTLLYLKATMDGVASIALASTLGVGVGFSVIPILAIQGGLALGAHAVQPYLTPAVIRELSAAGGTLILAIGLDLAKVKRLPVGNMLPAILVAAVAGWFWG